MFWSKWSKQKKKKRRKKKKILQKRKEINGGLNRRSMETNRVPGEDE